MEIIEIQGIGKVLLQENARVKRMSIKLKPFEPIKVVFPPRTPKVEALRFVNANKQWILEALAKIAEKENQLTVFDESTEFKTRNFVLQIRKSPLSQMRMQLKNGVLNIEYPQNIDVHSAAIQENIRYAIEEALRLTAKNYLPTRLHQLATQYGFKYNRVFIKNLKSRWGSCSYVNNINLNLHLMRLPDNLIDNVLLHELCHTVEKNHGAGFWNLMNKVTQGKAKSLDAEMKTYRTIIY